MAVGKFKFYDMFKLRIADGTLDLDSNAINAGLFTSASNCNTLGVGTGLYGDLTNELTTASGYTVGGQAVSGLTVSQLTGTGKWTGTLPTWNASGGNLVFRFLVLWVNATVNTIVKPLIAVSLLNTTPADTTITDGTGLQFIANASGIYTLTGGTTD